MKEKDFITLLQLQQIIKKGVEKSASETVWVRGEIVEIKENYSGHCYLELADYSENAQLVAKARAVIWASNYRVIKPYFNSVTGQDIESGMHVLLRVQVQYSVLYGLSLVVIDIDPQFSVGEMELKRQEAIKRLTEDGVIDLNRQLPLPRIIRKIAVVSAASAAGYRDFVQHLANNEYGLKFSTYLFPSPMQGADTPQGVISALDKIFEYNQGLLDNGKPGFDVVAVIRGGGSIMDLSAFDDYGIASHIAQFPLPVITGIGHDHDFHIADMVANRYFKTPTAVADFIIDTLAGELAMIESYCSRIKLAVVNKLNGAQNRLDNLKSRLMDLVLQRVLQEEYKLKLLEQKLKSSDPSLKLLSGEVIVEVNGKTCKSVSGFKDGAEVFLYMQDGYVNFTVNNVKIVKKQ